MSITDAINARNPSPLRNVDLNAAVRDVENDAIKSRRRRLITVNSCRIGLLASFLLAWQFLTGTPGESGVILDVYYVSQPSEIWMAIRDWAADGVLISSILTTLANTFGGFFLGAAGGMIFGFFLALNRFAGDVIWPFFEALNAIPRIALVPLFVVWFGIGMPSKVALVAVVVFFPVFYNCFYGVREVDRQLIDTIKLMQRKWWQLHTTVTIPSAMTWIITGLRVSVPFALVVAVAAEMLSSNQGMGFLIARAQGQFNTAGVFAGVAILMVVGMILGYGVTLLERRLLHWKRTGES